MKKTIKIFSLMFAVATLSLLASCQPDDNTGAGNGILGSVLDASFTVTPVTGATNTYLVKAVYNNYITSKWNAGTKGAKTFVGRSEEKLYFSEAGTYKVTHIAVGIGGQSYSSTKEIVIATSDPAAEVVKGGALNDAADWAQWTFLNISGGANKWVFAPGSVTYTYAGEHQGIYQAIDIVAGQNYNVEMTVSSTTGLTDTWFEVYVMPQVPVQGADYGNYGNDGVAGINTWVGCGKEPFNDLLSVVGCGGKYKGSVTFSTSGKVYMVIRSGSNLNSGNTITLKNISMRKA